MRQGFTFGALVLEQAGPEGGVQEGQLPLESPHVLIEEHDALVQGDDGVVELWGNSHAVARNRVVRFLDF